MEDDARSVCTKTHRTCENLEEVQQLLTFNRRLCTQAIVKGLTLDSETVKKILTKDLEMTKMSAKMVLRILTDEQ